MKKNHLFSGTLIPALIAPSIAAATPTLNLNSAIAGFSHSQAGIESSIGILLLAVGLFVTVMAGRIKKQPVRIKHRSDKRNNNDQF